MSDSAPILRLTEDIFYGYILPKVGINDVVRLRRVCKSLKIFGDAYLRVHHVTQEREINEDGHSFAEFLRRDLPSSSIYLNNRDISIFEQPEVPLFLEKYGDQVTHLRVNHFATCLSPAEDKFYGGLGNLQHLEIMFTDASGRECRNIFGTGNTAPIYIPPNFQNLKTLKINDMKTRAIYDQEYYYELFRFCVNLEHLKHPRFLEGTMLETSGKYKDGPFGIIKAELEKRLASGPTPRLQVFDVEHHQHQHHHVEIGRYRPAFLSLVATAVKTGLRFWNVDRDLLGNFGGDLLPQVVVSVRDLAFDILVREMPLLEKVTMTTMRGLMFPEGAFEDVAQSRWPQLKEVDFHVGNEAALGKDSPIYMPHFEVLDQVQFLFEKVKRPGLTTLKLAFDREGICEPGDKLPCPRASKMVENCGNLKVLHLYNWQGTNKALSLLWQGLEKLEEVTLEKCGKMGNVALVGERVEDPTFLKLKKLQNFSLLGLDEMLKVTDTVFHLVFKHLKIREFRITSDKPISSVSIKGIRALTEGSFQDSVDKFPFTGWSLENVGEEEWNQLEKEFRASFMR